MQSKIELGQYGEQLAVDFLLKQKYKIIKRNWRCHYGELDIVAQENDVLCFVEVRTKTNVEYGSPFETITQTKQRKLIQLAQEYIQENDCEEQDARFDVMAVDLTDNLAKVEIIKNAFELSS